LSRPDSGVAVERRPGEPVDRLFALYAALSGIAWLFPGRPSGWPVLLALHGLAAFIGFGAAPALRAWDRIADRFPRAARVLADWYPLALVPALYTELAALNRSVHGGRFFDPAIMRWEEEVFGGQPSREWAANAPNLGLSEALHAAYLSYYILIYVPPLILYARGRRLDFRLCVFVLMLTFFVHYLFFIYFPVQGPRYLFPAPDGIVASGFFYALAHKILEAGSSQGAAFPSSHVGVAVTQTLMMGRVMRALVVPAAVLTVGLALGAIYGGFHYATDAVLGGVLGVLAVIVGPALYERLSGTGHTP
jgi:membrane-associated phospholipid phosphatase